MCPRKVTHQSMFCVLNLKLAALLITGRVIDLIHFFCVPVSVLIHFVLFVSVNYLNSTKLKTKLRKKFQHLHEGIAKQGNLALLNEIYTELYITEGENGETDSSSKREETEDTPINSNDIFKPLPGQDQPIRTVLTKGVAGIGKTVSVQKFILVWAEGKENQDVHLIFPLPFRELNLLKDQTFNLQEFFMGTNQLEISPNDGKIIFIFDGLDECRLSLDFNNSVRMCDVTESASVDVLLTNLIVGNLVPSALIWITSRPAAADLVPSKCVHRVTEVRGFNDPQKEEYFRKRISDQILSDRIISHLKSSRSLYIMCHIPVFCWISATVLEKMLSQAEIGEIPKTLTQMYTHFLIIQIKIKHEKDYEKKVNSEDLILKLGKLAFQQLIEGNLMFCEEDLRECGIDVIEASVYSGLCTCREDLHQRKVYSFIHLTIQEHLAALYVHHSFTKNNINLFNVTEPTSETKNKQILIFDLHKKVVDEAVNSKTGHLDLFLRFLLGFSLDSNQTLLEGLLTQTESSSRGTCCFHNLEETVKYIRKKIEEHPTPEKFINLFHCLSDLGDFSLIDQMLCYLNTKSLTNTLSSLQWSALIFVLLTSENLGVFKFKNFASVKDSEQMLVILLKLLPVIEASTSVQLTECGLTEESCVPLAKSLCSEASCVIELNLSANTLKDEGVKIISKGLQNPHCKLEILRLRNCDITNEGCTLLNSVLTSKSSQLRELDLSENKLGDLGLKLLCDALLSPHCKLENLTINDCGVTVEGCAALASVMKSNLSHLKYLDLSNNQLGHAEVKFLSDGLKSPLCKLEILRLRFCGLYIDEGCDVLASALNSNPHLKTLDMTGNKLGDSRIKLLSAIFKNPCFKLETLCCTIVVSRMKDVLLWHQLSDQTPHT
uniref:Si:dkey-23k10.2 n=1 Tax=Cyprinus carpio TaxID=7962 RepID=A0A8C1UZ18_CYPCA